MNGVTKSTCWAFRWITKSVKNRKHEFITRGIVDD
jgi:hypothetical protein